jgi:hypothetical protein
MVKYDTDKTSIAPINLDLAEKVNRVFFPCAKQAYYYDYSNKPRGRAIIGQRQFVGSQRHPSS